MTRWTIRGVDEPTRDIVRRAAAFTGRSAGEIVKEALAEWAERNPDAVAYVPDVDDELTAALKQLNNQMLKQKQLLSDYFYGGQFHKLGDPI